MSEKLVAQIERQEARIAELEAQRNTERREREYAQSVFRNLRDAVGDVYGELDRFDSDPAEFIRWCHRNYMTWMTACHRAEAKLGEATADLDIALGELAPANAEIERLRRERKINIQEIEKGLRIHASQDEEIARLRESLEEINGIRNSIIGLQSVNWSQHIYPLVSALDGAGFEGAGYKAAHEYMGSLLDQFAEKKAEIERLRERVRLLDADIDSCSGKCLDSLNRRGAAQMAVALESRKGGRG